LHDAGELWRSRDELESFSQLRERIQPLVDTEGTDATSAVTVRLSPEGHLSDLRIAMDWEKRLTDDAPLAEAVMAAMTDATTRRLLAQQEAWQKNADAPAARATPAPLPSESFAARLEEVSHFDPDRATFILSELEAFVDEVNEAVDGVGGGAANLSGSCNSAKTSLLQKLSDLSAYPGGSWPRAVGI
jgi:hypothetical protein